MDNHDSHVSVPVIDYAKKNGIIMLTFPPHCSHKLQPLDRSVYGPLKRYYNTACDAWMLENPGKPMTIYDVAGRVGRAFPLAMTPTNIQAGFRVSGNWPFNRDIFTGDEFLSSYVTDRPVPGSVTNNSASTPQISEEHGILHSVASQSSMSPAMTVTVASASPDSAVSAFLPSSLTTVSVTPTTSVASSCALPLSTAASVTVSAANLVSANTTTHSVTVTPDQIKPYPKAGDRKSTQQRKRGKSQVLTDTPVKAELERQDLLRKTTVKEKARATTSRKHLRSS